MYCNLCKKLALVANICQKWEITNLDSFNLLVGRNMDACSICLANCTGFYQLFCFGQYSEIHSVFKKIGSFLEWLEIAMNLTRDSCVETNYKPLRGTFLDTTNCAFSVEYVLRVFYFSM